jgi:hypothetical protein
MRARRRWSPRAPGGRVGLALATALAQAAGLLTTPSPVAAQASTGQPVAVAQAALAAVNAGNPAGFAALSGSLARSGKSVR